MHALAHQFDTALKRINIDDERRRHAIAAHTQIRELLEGEEQLCAWGVDTALIGSYRRHTGIYPGKDVDVFTKLTELSVDDTDPPTIYRHVRDLLVGHYGGRAEPQPRSVKVSFDTAGFEFSVDAVPAVRMGERWAIPRYDTTLWDDPERRWVETDPEKLTELTERLNGLVVIGGQGGYVPVVKLVRQARCHHRGDEKPGGFYFELMTYWAFRNGEVGGDTYAEVFAATLSSIARQLQGGAELIDPVLGTAYRPSPEPGARTATGHIFSDLASQAQAALSEDSRCKAAAIWREILGRNDQGMCFPIPDGCDEHGRALPVTAVGSSRGSREPGGFA
jgi:Second Messenger Oligonucleotide or Dinucleotide Synthetase domain